MMHDSTIWLQSFELIKQPCNIRNRVSTAGSCVKAVLSEKIHLYIGRKHEP